MPLFRPGQRVFYVQSSPRDVWHVETPDDPELMLCGVRISVNNKDAKVQNRPGLKSCLWCTRRLKDELSFLLPGSLFPSSRPSLRSRSRTQAPVRTTLTGSDTPVTRILRGRGLSTGG